MTFALEVNYFKIVQQKKSARYNNKYNFFEILKKPCHFLKVQTSFPFLFHFIISKCIQQVSLVSFDCVHIYYATSAT